MKFQTKVENLINSLQQKHILWNSGQDWVGWAGRDHGKGLFLREGLGVGFRKVGMRHWGGQRWHSELGAGDKVEIGEKLDLMTLEGSSKLGGSGIVGRGGCRSWGSWNGRAEGTQIPSS